MPSAFCDELRARHAARWHALLDHLVLRGIASGDLPLACFAFHQIQDRLYLEALAAALAQGIPSAGSRAEATLLSELRASALVERDAIEGRAGALGLERRALLELKPTEVTRVYDEHLTRAAQRGAGGELFAALLPCQLAYPAIAARYAGATPAPALYRAWLASCGAPELLLLAERCAAALEARSVAASVDERARWSETYAESLRLERLFLQAALERRSWPRGHEEDR